jgi:hypothetical protein
MRIEPGAYFVVNRPDWFRREDFLCWMAMECRATINYSNHREPDEWTEAITAIDPSLSGEGWDQPNGRTHPLVPQLPEDIWAELVEAVRAEIGARGVMPPRHHILIRITNMER